jgi:glycosyltransferase involved in cell wall biosynthesis
VVNTHSIVDVSTLVWRAARKHNVPIVHTLRDYDMLCGNAAMFRRGEPCNHWHLGCKITNLSKLWTNKWVSAVVAVGQATLDRHLDHGFFSHLPPERRRVIWNGAIVPDKASRDRDTFDRSQQPMTFGYLGRINIEKGVDTVIQAFRNIGPGNWRVRIAGQAPDTLDYFKKRSEGLPIEFVGWVDPFEFFRELDVLIVPSIWAEPLPRTILESYAIGVPVIGSRSGGIPDLIGPNNDPWLFEPGNADDLATKIKRVLDETRPPRVAQKYLDVYDSVLALSGAARG